MYRIGIDLGGTNIACGLVSDEMKIIEKVSVPTGAGRDPALIVDDMAAACRTLIEKAGVGIGEIAAVGIASPGIANHDDGVVEYANNLPFRRFPIASMLRERFPVDNIRVENDANAAAWGEAVAGAAKGTSSSVMITLGTGVGGGIIVDGKVQSGFNYAGGELGHIVICAGGRKCSCGRRGCWEAYSSATALIAMTEEKIADCEARGEKTVMKELAEKKGKVSARTAYDAMRLGDPAAIEVVDEYVFYLACGLTNIVNIFQPEVISIGGGISNEKDTLLKPLLPIIRKEQYGGGLVPETEIRIAELGNDAGIIGAAFLGL
ncbi:MAG: ROK family protein [Clostridiales bacterium]|nr:ROK family protein [Clostridiales bacterium]